MEEKALHGKWAETTDETDQGTSQWLRTANLKPVTEALITAAQDQALNTNWHVHHIIKNKPVDKCRACSEYPETVEHIVSGCPRIAQTLYMKRHNAVAATVHWGLCANMGFERAEHWWQHQPETAMENESFKLLYDFNVMTDKKITARRPDIIIVDKKNRHTTIIDVSCPADRNIKNKETHKIEKYQDLKIELQRLWNTRIDIVPIVIGALGAITSNLEGYLLRLNTRDININQMQKNSPIADFKHSKKAP